MPFYACMLAGECLTTGPIDVCKMMYGPVPGPIPCENMAMWLMAVGLPDILFSGMPACSILCLIEMSEDDEDGYLGGLISETIMELVMAEIGSVACFLMGAPAVSLGESMTMQNLINSMGLYSVPSQCVISGP